MKRSKKSILCCLISAVVMVASSLMVGCKTKTKIDSANPSSLEVYIINAGYGYKWCEKMLDDFKKEDWVKEKYPELAISLSQDALDNTASTNISSGDTNFDIIFSLNCNGYANEDYAADITSSVYNQKVPGEDILYKDKMMDSYLSSMGHEVNGETHYFMSSWANTMTGIAYNEDVLHELGFRVPNTTDELIAICDSIYTGSYKDNAPYKDGKKTGKIDTKVYSNKQSFITYGVSPYTNYPLNTWWVQYEGEDKYLDFFNGRTDKGIDVKALKQEGRLKALTVLEELHKKRNGVDGYTSLQEGSGREAFRKAQNNVVLGKSLFMCNGDWFDNEMRNFTQEAKENGIKVGTVKLMKAPIMSSIIEKLETINDDATLSKVVEAIDNNKAYTTVSGVSQEDFNVVKQARQVMYSIGSNHSVLIPKGSPAKDLASDFMLYMATDKCLETYIRETKGNSLPFDYDIQAKNPNLLSSLSPMGQQCLTMATDSSTKILPDITRLPLVLNGGLTFYKSIADKAGMYMYSENRTAQTIYDEDYKYWTEANRWENACQNAGI